MAHQGFAFLYQIQVLDKTAIRRLSDEKLMDAYVDVLVEVEASTAFHQTSGFKPSDYRKFKDLIRYRILLKQEIEKRKLESPNEPAAVQSAPQAVPAP